MGGHEKSILIVNVSTEATKHQASARLNVCAIEIHMKLFPHAANCINVYILAEITFVGQQHHLSMN